MYFQNLILALHLTFISARVIETPVDQACVGAECAEPEIISEGLGSDVGALLQRQKRSYETEYEKQVTGDEMNCYAVETVIKPLAHLKTNGKSQSVFHSMFLDQTLKNIECRSEREVCFAGITNHDDTASFQCVTKYGVIGLHIINENGQLDPKPIEINVGVGCACERSQKIN